MSWSNASPRIRALLATKSRLKSRLDRPVHLQRVEIQVFLGETPIKCRLLAADVQDESLFLYTKDPVPNNAPLTIKTTTPTALQISGEVVWCNYLMSPSAIQTQDRFSYRVGIRLLFLKEEERTTYQTWAETLKNSYQAGKRIEIFRTIAGVAEGASVEVLKKETPAAESALDPAAKGEASTPAAAETIAPSTAEITTSAETPAPETAEELKKAA